MGDLVGAEHTALTEHTLVIADPSAYDYTVVTVQTPVVIVVVVQIASVVQNMDEVAAV